jgi:hypothetical protein
LPSCHVLWHNITFSIKPYMYKTTSILYPLLQDLRFMQTTRQTDYSTV